MKIRLESINFYSIKWHEKHDPNFVEWLMKFTWRQQFHIFIDKVIDKKIINIAPELTKT